MNSPYKILDLPEDATLDQVKEKYRELAKEHHPDKGGSAEMFKIIKLAFRMIVDSHKKGVPIAKQTVSTFTDLKDAAQNYPAVQKQAAPHEFLGINQPVDPNRNFSTQQFNEKFMQNRNTGDDYLLAAGGDATDYREGRTKDQLLSEQAAIDSELGQIRPMFAGRGEFNNNAFQRMFQMVNGTLESNTKALQPHEEPAALVSGLQPFTEIDNDHKIKQTDKLSSLQFSGYDEGFNGGRNPNQIDRDMLSTFSTQPDITDANTIEADYHQKVKKRLNDYNSFQPNFHPKPENPGQLPEELRSQKSTLDRVSQTKMNDAYSRKMQERNMLTNQLKYGAGNAPPSPSMGSQDSTGGGSAPDSGNRGQQAPLRHQSLPIMEYPRSSNGSGPGPTSASPSPQQAMPQIAPMQMRPLPPPTAASDDYFAKIQVPIPTTYYPQQPQLPHLPQYQQQQPQYQHPPQFQPTMMPMYPPTGQQDSGFAMMQIQQQLMELQRTVLAQNKVIRKLNIKKKN